MNLATGAREKDHFGDDLRSSPDSDPSAVSSSKGPKRRPTGSNALVTSSFLLLVVMGLQPTCDGLHLIAMRIHCLCALKM